MFRSASLSRFRSSPMAGVFSGNEGIVSPLALGNTAAWYDVSDLSSMRNDAGNIPASGEGIKLWADKSGNSSVNVLAMNAAANSQAYATLTGQNIGSSDFSLSLSLNYMRANGTFEGYAQISPNQASGEAVGRSLNVNHSNTDVFRVYLYGATTSDFRLASISGIRATYRGVKTHFAIAVTGTSLKIYINGVDTAYVETTGGTPPDWNSGLTSTYLGLGYNAVGNVLDGVMYNAALYNKGLSQAEVTALVAANGSPAAGDRWGTMTGPVAGCIAYYDFSTGTKLANTLADASSNNLTLTVTGGGATGARISGARDLVNLVAASQPILTIAAGGNYLTFDGSNDYLKAAAFSLSQPETVYFVGSQVSWADTDYVFDGNGSDSMALLQTSNGAGASPRVKQYAGSYGGAVDTWALNTTAIVTAVYSGAASLVRVNRGASVAGASTGTAAASGFSLGRLGGAATNLGNITAQEVAIFSTAQNTAQQDAVILYLGRKYGIAV